MHSSELRRPPAAGRADHEDASSSPASASSRRSATMLAEVDARRSKDGKSGISSCRSTRNCGFRSQIAGTLKLNVDELVDRRLAPLHGRRRGLCLSRHEAGDRRRGPGRDRDLQRTHRRDRGLGRPDAPAPSCRPPSSAETKGSQAVWPVRGAEGHVRAPVLGQLSPPPTRSRVSSYSISSACSTSAHCIGNAVETASSSARPTACSPAAARNSTGRCRVPVRRHGRACRPVQRHAPSGRAAPTTRDRDGFVISGGGGIMVLRRPRGRQGARRQDLRRGDRLRRHRPTAPTWWRPRAKARCAA